MYQSNPSRPDNPQVSAALERVLASPSFSRSTRLAGFLRFLVNEYLEGREASLKEYVLGVQVFGRDANYDPRTDPIVRVQARQLRFKLREYYETAGREERIRIEIPKGSYVAAISYAADGNAGGWPRAAEGDPGPEPVTPGAVRRPKSRWIFAAMLLVSATAASLVFAKFSNVNWPHHQAKVDPAAQDLYMKGKFCWNRRTPESLNQAVDFFTQAIVRDPGYAKAYAGLADCYNLLREYSVMPPSVAWPRAIAAARRAVELDPLSAEAHTSLGFALFNGALDPAGGERELRRALELDPNYEKAHHWYATSLMAIGRNQEALAEIERARELDPTSESIVSDEGFILYYCGQPAHGIEVLKQIESVDSSFASPHKYLASIYLSQGDSINYLSEARKAAELSHDDRAIDLEEAARKAFAVAGTPAMLKAILKHQTAMLAEGRGSHYEVAESYARLGKHAQAIDELQAAVDNREIRILTLCQDPSLARLRGEPRYENLRKQVKQSLRI